MSAPMMPRRSLLSCSVSALVAGVAGAAATAGAADMVLLSDGGSAAGEAELLHACGNLVRAEREYDAAAAVLLGLTFDDPRYDAIDARVDAAVAESRSLARLIGDTPPVGTRAAIEARAAALRAFMPIDGGDGDDIPIDWHRGMLDRLLGEIGADVAPSRSASQPSPDAELLSTCAAFDAIEARIVALDGDRDEVLLAKLERERQPVLNCMCELRAYTLAGARARAATLALYAPDLLEPFGDYVDQRMVAALLRDLVDGCAA